MTDTDPLIDLLVRWEEQRQQARLLTPQELADFVDARRSLSDVLEANPVCAEAAAERGHLELSWGRYRTKVIDRRGAHDHYANAVRFFEEAMKMNDSLSGSLRDWHREARRGMLGAY